MKTAAMIQREQQLIKTAIVSLLVILALVYLLVYSVYYRPSSQKGSDAQTGSESPTTYINPTKKTKTTIQNKQTKVIEKTTTAVINSDTPTSSKTPSKTIKRGSSGISSAEVSSQSIISGQEQKQTSVSGRSLPGTTRVEKGSVADEIGLQYSYALQDSKGIYYVNLGSSTQDVGALLQRKGGTTFALTTPTKILANKLFGSRVTYLNLPAYKNKLVLMVVVVGNERRMIQIPYSIYHQSKKYIAEKFNQ